MDAITARIGELPMSEECRQDYESGDWLFGRGSADMKFGHALIIELLRHYGEDISALSGNLLYVAVCGEETNSEGMLTAALFLNKLAAERNLHYRALLLSECYLNDDMAHDPTRYIHYGATGKVMPLFFCAGKGCHADEPFVGLDANALNAAVHECGLLRAYARRMHPAGGMSKNEGSQGQLLRIPTHVCGILLQFAHT